MKKSLFLISLIVITAVPVSAQITAADLTGSYQVEPPQNNWHIVEITLEGEDLIWTNAAGVSWNLIYENGVLKSAPDSTYGENILTINSNPPGSDTINSLTFRGAVYVRQNTPPTLMTLAPPCCTNFSAPATTTIIMSVNDREGNLDRVEFWKNDVLVSTDTTEPYELNLNGLTEGTHFYQVIAYDDEGLSNFTFVPIYVNRAERAAEFEFFWDKNGGRPSFSPHYSNVIERCMSAVDEMEDGDFHEVRTIVDDVFEDYPYGDPTWTEIKNEVRDTINTGNPPAYYSLRMLDEIAKIANSGVAPPQSEALKMAIVIADTAFGIRPLNADFSESEDVTDLQINPEILTNDYEKFRMSLRVFQEYLWAITDGKMHLEYEFHHVTDGVEVTHNSGPTTFRAGLQDYTDPIYQLPVNIRNSADMFWVVYPSNRPPPPMMHSMVVVSGGMGSYGNCPVFIGSDYSLIYNHNMDTLIEKTDVERQLYMNQWFQHEFFHHLFRSYPEFGLEVTAHQWFDRNTWPADFVGSSEPDYYAEALNKRLRTAEVEITDTLKAGKYWQFSELEKVTIDQLVGHYEKLPIANDWHIVDVTRVGDKLRWTNAAGVWWNITFEDNVLMTEGGPYAGQELFVEFDSLPDGSVEVTGLVFSGKLYSKSFDSGVIVNGGFEDDSTGWNLGANAEVTTEKFKRETSSLKLNSNPGNTSQTISIEPNTDYELSVWVDASGITANGIHFDTLDKFDPGNAPGGTCQFNIDAENADGWTRFSGTFNSADETSVTLRIYGNDMQGAVYFDNIRLRALPQLDPYDVWRSAHEFFNPKDYLPIGSIYGATSALTFNTDTLQLSGGISGSGQLALNEDSTEVAVFAFSDVNLEVSPVITGSRPLVIVSNKNLRIASTVNLNGSNGGHASHGAGNVGGGNGGDANRAESPGNPFDGQGAGGSIGNTSGSEDNSSAGGGYGGLGGAASGLGGSTYGDRYLSSLLGGSGAGGTKNKGGGAGGGGLALVAANNLEITSSAVISAKGGNGAGSGAQYTSGGGSGGGLRLQGKSVIINGTLNANGGNGGNATGGQLNGGGGGGGRVVVYYRSTLDLNGSSITVLGGVSAGSNSTGQDGVAGTILYFKAPSLLLDDFENWKFIHNITDDAGDDDNDGVLNFTEFALGGDPQSALSGQRPVVSRNGSNYDFQFRRNEESVTYTIEKSTDLLNWSHHVTVLDIHGVVGEDCTVPVPIAEMAGGKLFLRLRVEK